MLDLQQLRQLVAIEDAGSLSAAAETLHLSQPALSRSMQRLEAELGLTLFERSRNRLSFGALGRRAAAGARALLRDTEKYADELRDYALQLSTLRIGACSPASLWRLSVEIRERFPACAVAEEQQGSAQLTEGLRGGRFRLILTDEAVLEAGVLCRNYLEERLVLELPPTHALCRHSALTLDALRGLNVLTYRNVGVWRQRIRTLLGVHPIELSEPDVLEELAMNSELPLLRSSISPFPSSASGRRVTLPILGDAAGIPLYLCAREYDRALFEQLC